MDNKLEFVVKDIKMTGAGNGLSKGPVGFKKTLISLQIPYNNISFKPAKHFMSSQGSGGGQEYRNRGTGRI